MIQNSRLIFQNVIQQTNKRNVTFPTIACDIKKKKKDNYNKIHIKIELKALQL